MNYQLMAKLSGSYGVEKMARVLKVSRSGYYAWVDRSQRARECGTVELTEQIRDIQRQMHHRYGTPRVTRELARRGRSVGHNRVARILREKSLGARPKRRFRVTTKAALGPAVAANELDRNFWAAGATAAGGRARRPVHATSRGLGRALRSRRLHAELRRHRRDAPVGTRLDVHSRRPVA